MWQIVFDALRNLQFLSNGNKCQRKRTHADLATRPILADNLKDSLWYSGPQEFLDDAYLLTDYSHPLMNPVKDKELRPTQVLCILKTNISTYPTGLVSHRFQSFFLIGEA